MSYNNTRIIINTFSLLIHDLAGIGPGLRGGTPKLNSLYLSQKNFLTTLSSIMGRRLEVPTGSLINSAINYSKQSALNDIVSMLMLI